MIRRLTDHEGEPGAACAELDPAEADRIFFPQYASRGLPAAARLLCGNCLVRNECALLALEAEEDEQPDHIFGIYGGFTAGERRRLLADRRNRRLTRSSSSGVP